MSDSSKAAVLKKPSKKFPLTPRGDGRWCKKIAGKLRYIKGNADEALAEWLRVKDYWLSIAAARITGRTATTHNQRLRS